ncbi:MAG: YkgJ family cysteine cluster protein [Flavobacteriales bacterium]|nr:YkgJ family cysteine cluster protein [Flavobacteriales bacterium]
MKKKQDFNIKAFHAEYKKKKKILGPFIKNIHRRKIKGLRTLVNKTSNDVWKEIDCTRCANCCKKMTPTFTQADIKRVATYLNMSRQDFITKYLEKDEDGMAWINKKRPCQFLGKDNLCTIYEVRPYDCKGFPHIKHSRWLDQRGVFETNMEYCPATLKMVELMFEKITGHSVTHK